MNEIDSAGYDKFGYNYYQPNKEYNREYENMINEGNDLIAAFEGHIWKKDKHWVNEYGSDYSYEGPEEFEGWWHKDCHAPADTNYHFEWNLLMPVVRKINEHGYSMEGQLLAEQVYKACGVAEIMLVWHKVVEFIKWYNENGKS